MSLAVTRLAITVALLLVAAPLGTEAQQAGKVPRVGVLSGQAPGASSPWGAFREGLREHGYVEGQNVVIEWRPSQGSAERLPNLAAELVRIKVDVIVAVDNPAITAAQGASRAIPIVMVLATDPVGTGFVASLARPGGNITGLTLQATEWQGKSLQLLKEASPNVSRVGILWDPTEPGPGRRAQAREAEVAGAALALQVQLFGPRSPAELDSVFTVMTRERVHAVLIQPSQMIYAHRARIAQLEAKSRLPTMGWRRETVEAGGLIPLCQ